MKTTLFILFFAIFSMTCFSQTYQIMGSVIDNQGNRINYAGVSLIQNDSVVRYAMTDEAGNFLLINAEQGEYALEIRLFGDILFSQDITLNENIDLGTIAVEQTVKLQEVTITARKKLIEQKTDRLVFNVQNSIVAAGGTALDALNITPRISLNGGQISMIGKSSMSITVNDRPLKLSGVDLENYLKSISSENIESIEVISNPPAKYEAAGNSGIVNIRLKAPKADSWNTSFSSSYKQSTYATGSLGGRFAYQKNKLSISASASYMDGSSGSLEKQTVYYPSETFFNNRDGRNFYKGFSGLFGIDYRLNKKWSVGVQYSGSFSKPETKNDIIGTVKDLNSNPQQTLKTEMNNPSKNNNNALNIHSIYNFNSSGKTLSLDADYFNYKKNQNQIFATNSYDADNSFIPDSFSSLNNTGEQNIENYSVKIDMQHPLEWLKLNYGGKISFTTTNNDLAYYDLSSGVPEYDSSLSNTFRYTENNQSLYLSAEKKWNEKWNLQLGLRLENTQTTGYSLTTNEAHDQNYTKLFPTAYLAYTPNDKHSFSLSYGKRISRPRFSMLNPFKRYISSYKSSSGNPYLEPSFMNNIELNYTYRNNLNVTLYYSDETNGYSSVTILEPDSILQNSTMLNFYTGYSYGTYIGYTFKKFKWLESYLSGNAYYTVTHADYPGIQRNTDGWGASLSASNSFVLNAAKTFLGSLDLFYSFPNTYVISQNKASFIASLGLRYILNKNLTFNLSLRDIFKTNTQRWSETNDGILMNYYNYSDARNIILSVTWRFGNNKISSRSPKTGNTEEKNRAN